MPPKTKPTYDQLQSENERLKGVIRALLTRIDGAVGDAYQELKSVRRYEGVTA